jgi:hypothetical protein
MQVTDPVCGMTIESEKAVACEVWRGQTYYLCPNHVWRIPVQPLTATPGNPIVVPPVARMRAEADAYPNISGHSRQRLFRTMSTALALTPVQAVTGTLRRKPFPACQ